MGSEFIRNGPSIESFAVISRFNRGYNNTGSIIPAYKFLSAGFGQTFNYPNVITTAGNSPCLGLNLLDFPNLTGSKLLRYGAIQFPSGIIDTSLIPLNTIVYVSNTGDLTLNPTNIKAGHTLTQGINPWIMINVQYFPDGYIEFSFTNLVNQVFNHDFGKYSNIIIIDSLGNDITSSLNVIHDANKKSLTIQSNIPVTGKLICNN